MEFGVKKRGMTETELSLFKKCYPDTTRKKLSDTFGISERAVEAYAYRLKLKKSEKYIVMVKKKGAEAAWMKRMNKDPK